MSGDILIRTAVPTRDRPGSLPLSLLTLALHLPEGSELFVYDDGDAPAAREYGTRFALDLAVQRGLLVNTIRGKPAGIHKARARMLEDAELANVDRLLMVDDDIILPATEFAKLTAALDSEENLEYAVPIVRLANNEAGVREYGDPDPTKPANQQFVLNQTGGVPVIGGAWTCAILLDLTRFDVHDAVKRLSEGPPVVEDFVLTHELAGQVVRHAQVWHVMTPDQGDRGWEGRALEYLRNQIRRSHRTVRS